MLLMSVLSWSFFETIVLFIVYKILLSETPCYSLNSATVLISMLVE